jgi:hypothetical protein
MEELNNAIEVTTEELEVTASEPVEIIESEVTSSEVTPEVAEEVTE